MSVLQASDLHYAPKAHFWSRPTPILRGVSLLVEAGELFGFLGPNGAGKTTTIKALLGLLQQHSGQALLFGRPPTDPEARRKVGFMPENAYFPQHLKGHELVTFHGTLAGLSLSEARRRAGLCLERVGLADAAAKPLSTYSKGMLTRAGLAQALVADPELLVLDEPMSGLDPIGRREVREVMIELSKSGKTIFFSTHILPDVEMICDRIAILNRGKVHRIGPLAELQSDNEARFEITAHCSPATVDALRPQADAVVPQRDGITFEVLGSERANALLDALRQEQATVLSMQSRGASLEDLFVQVTGGAS